MRFMLTGSMMLAASMCLAQHTYYAPDLGQSDDHRAYLGLVNPGESMVTVTLVPHAGDGTTLIAEQRQIPPYGRLELDSRVLFPTAERGWVHIESDGVLNGYVRHKASGGGHAASPIASVSGREVWLPQIQDVRPGLASRFAITNTVPVEGTATSDPVFRGEGAPRKNDTPQTLPGFGLGNQQITLDYGIALEKAETVLWDHIASNDGLELVGTQHLIDQEGTAAAITLTRTPFRRLVFGPLQPNESGTWNKLVMVNTNPVPLPVTITAYQRYYNNTDITVGDPVSYELTLDPYEQRVVDITHPTLSELPANASWLSATAAEAGLLGYQLFGSEDGETLGAIETGVVPTSVSSLPYTPSDDDYETEIAMINPGEESAFIHLYGYADNGAVRGKVIRKKVRPSEKLVLTTDQLFGESAGEITWVRVLHSHGELFTYSLVKNREGGDALALQGTATLARDGELFLADFDHFGLDTMEGQGWTGYHFTDGGELDDTWVLNWETQYGHTSYLPGNFSLEEALDGEDGFFYQGYEPLNSSLIVAEGNGNPEQVAFVSPWIEVPEFGTWYASFQLRFFNPELVTQKSNFGIAWRVDGSNEWHWSGMNGWHLIYPDLIVADCWAPITFRNEEVIVTNWLPFETVLPDEVLGKRIQIGYYFEFVPDGPGDTAPWMWLDRLRISTEPQDFALNYAPYGKGSFTVEE